MKIWFGCTVLQIADTTGLKPLPLLSAVVQTYRVVTADITVALSRALSAQHRGSLSVKSAMKMAPDVDMEAAENAAAEDKASKLYCFDRAKKGRLLWSFNANPYGYWSTPALVGNRLYIGAQNNYLYCVDATTGKEVWNYRTGAAIWSSPAVQGGRVVFGSYDSHLYVLDAKNGRLINRIKLDGKCLATPIIDKGKIYVGTGTGTFYCIG